MGGNPAEAARGRHFVWRRPFASFEGPNDGGPRSANMAGIRARQRKNGSLPATV